MRDVDRGRTGPRVRNSAGSGPGGPVDAVPGQEQGWGQEQEQGRDQGQEQDWVQYRGQDVTARSTGETVLRVLRVTLHVGFAALLVVAVGRALAVNPHAVQTYVCLVLAFALAVIYLIGTTAEKRHADDPERTLDPARYGIVWLAIVTALWVVLLILNADFSWLAFPLFFLHIHLLSRTRAVLAVAAMTAVVVTAQWWHHDATLQVAMVIGPIFGAAFSVVAGVAYEALYTEGVLQRAALDELRRTRHELATSQREAGALAERERLAREIHDTLAQGLSSIVLVSRAAETALTAAHTDLARKRIHTIHDTAAENLAEARRFVRGDAATAGAQESLAEGLRRLCDKTEREAAARGGALRCRFRLEGEPADLPQPYRVALMRAAQASLANVWAHAGAGVAVVTLGYLGSEVTLDVYDDGVGFDPEAVSAAARERTDGTGFGLRSLRERVDALGGSFEIESAPGEGTVVAVRLPLTGPDGDQATERQSRGDNE